MHIEETAIAAFKWLAMANEQTRDIAYSYQVVDKHELPSLRS